MKRFQNDQTLIILIDTFTYMTSKSRQKEKISGASASRSATASAVIESIPDATTVTSILKDEENLRQPASNDMVSNARQASSLSSTRAHTHDSNSNKISKGGFIFEDFYQAYGRSVPLDVSFENGELHIIKKTKKKKISSRKNKLLQLPPICLSSSTDSQANSSSQGENSETNDKIRLEICEILPERLRKLFALQEYDGSWKYSPEFREVFRGSLASGDRPPDGINGKMWATCAAIVIWRQNPEYFDVLEPYYNKALLHLDESVLNLAKGYIKVDIFNAEPQELEEKDDQEEEKEEEEHIEKIVFIKAESKHEDDELTEEEKITKVMSEQMKLIPKTVKKHLLKGCQQDIKHSFSVSNLPFLVDEEIQCCYRKKDKGIKPVVHDTWFPCLIYGINGDGTLNVHFLDGSQEKERHVDVKFVRHSLQEKIARREKQVQQLKAIWQRPVELEYELQRFEQEKHDRLLAQKIPWNERNSSIIAHRQDRSKNKKHHQTKLTCHHQKIKELKRRRRRRRRRRLKIFFYLKKRSKKKH
jgi:hypothetical protein